MRSSSIAGERSTSERTSRNRRRRPVERERDGHRHVPFDDRQYRSRWSGHARRHGDPQHRIGEREKPPLSSCSRAERLTSKVGGSHSQPYPPSVTKSISTGEIAFTTATSLTDCSWMLSWGPVHILGADRRLSTSSSSRQLTHRSPSVAATCLSPRRSRTSARSRSIRDRLPPSRPSRTLPAAGVISGTAAVSASGGITNSGTIQLDNNLVATSGGDTHE